MKKIVFTILFLGITTSFLAQNLQNYKYVKVPDKYEFLKEENQYQVNALTAFLFEKKGIEALYKENIPAGTDPCDVLQADVHSDSGLFRSRLYFTLKNCKNETVFTSKTGMSKEKDFRVSYHEALREAFESFEPSTLKKMVAKAEPEVIKIDPVATSEEIDTLAAQPEEVIVDPVVTANEIEAIDPEENTSEANKISERASEGRKFTNGAVTYNLKKTPAGFDLFKVGDDKKFAALLKSGGGNNYIYASENISGNAFFDTSGNLVVEYLDPNSQQLVSVIYKLQAQ